MFTCAPEPKFWSNGFGMNVAMHPSVRATCLAISRKISIRSAISSASVWRNSNSYCPSPPSWSKE